MGNRTEGNSHPSPQGPVQPTGDAPNLRRKELLIIAATVIGIKLIAAIIRFAANKAASNIRIHSITPSAPYAPHHPTIHNQSHSAETIQEALRLNQLMEFRLRDRLNQVNDAVRLNQLMDFGMTEITQNNLQAFLLEAAEISYEEERPASQVTLSQL